MARTLEERSRDVTLSICELTSEADLLLEALRKRYPHLRFHLASHAEGTAQSFFVMFEKPRRWGVVRNIELNAFVAGMTLTA